MKWKITEVVKQSGTDPILILDHCLTKHTPQDDDGEQVKEDISGCF
jgi:hypothetical protein